MMNSVTVTATEANRRFSALLRAAGEGITVSITSRGKEIAVLARRDPADEQARKRKALEALQATWATQEHVTIGPWTRDDVCSRY